MSKSGPLKNMAAILYQFRSLTWPLTAHNGNWPCGVRSPDGPVLCHRVPLTRIHGAPKDDLFEGLGGTFETAQQKALQCDGRHEAHPPSITTESGPTRGRQP